jgi:UDP-N-acetylglucosamine 2-epimerase
VEAGLRTGDLWQPFPEELNRRVADEVATLLFAPTEHSRQALLATGRDPSQILVTGNTVIDALHHVLQQPFALASSPLATLPLDKRLVLITAHRRESFGQPLRDICQAIGELAREFGPRGVEFVFPVHPNPNVCGPAFQLLANRPHVHLIEPLDYAALVQLMRRCALILTDSGGIQEEAPELGVPVLVLRETTERPEGVSAGVVRLVGTSRQRIVAESRLLLADESERQHMTAIQHPYGDGHAAERIVAALVGQH